MLKIQRTAMFGRSENSAAEIHSFTKHFVTMILPDGSRVKFRRHDGYEAGKSMFAWHVVDLQELEQLISD